MQIPVYEYQFGADLKEHVMRRRHDDWINATHILKAAGFDKPARTRILERDVQKDVHEKIQGGYGKYQGKSCQLLRASLSNASRNLDPARIRRKLSPTTLRLRFFTTHLRISAGQRKPSACPSPCQQTQSPSGRAPANSQVQQ